MSVDEYPDKNTRLVMKQQVARADCFMLVVFLMVCIIFVIGLVQWFA